jgi:hypothetical protein
MTGVGLDRPNALGNPYVRNTSTLFVSPAAFAPNAVGTFGNAGVFSLVGPRTWVQPLLCRARRAPAGSAVRSIQQYESRQLSTPVVSVQNARFGQITSAGDPRILQVAMKYGFSVYYPECHRAATVRSGRAQASIRSEVGKYSCYRAATAGVIGGLPLPAVVAR